MPTVDGEKRFLTFKGVGKGIFNDLAGNRVADVIRAQDVTIGWEVKKKDIFGGDPIFPFDTMVTEATGSVAITEGTLDMNVFYAQSGKQVEYGAQTTIWEIDEQATIPAATAYTVELAHAADQTGTPVVRFLDGSGALMKVETAPEAGQFSVAAGILTFAVADAGKAITIDYQRTITQADIATAPNNPKILFGTYIHTVKYLDARSKTEGLGQLVIYRCSYSGKNEINLKRGDASQPKLTFDMYDPGRPDGKVFDLIRFQ